MSVEIKAAFDFAQEVLNPQPNTQEPSLKTPEPSDKKTEVIFFSLNGCQVTRFGEFFVSSCQKVEAPPKASVALGPPDATPLPFG